MISSNSEFTPRKPISQAITPWANREQHQKMNSHNVNSNTAQPMTLDHPRWLDFCVKMQELDPKGGCHCTTDHAFDVLNILGVPVEPSLEYLRKQGGYCDCEIIMNVILPFLDEDA